MSKINKLFVAAVALLLCLNSNEVRADQPGKVGFGAVFSINTGGEISIGARIFNKKVVRESIEVPISECPGPWTPCRSVFLNSKGNVVATGGVNYNFSSGSFEPVLGVGYTFSNGLVAAEASYSFKDKKVNWNLAGGWGSAKREFLGNIQPIP